VGGKRSTNRPRPSYESGRLRDPAVEKLQDPKYDRGDLLAALKKAVQQAPPGKPPKGR
jgi:hypothetical protein